MNRPEPHCLRFARALLSGRIAVFFAVCSGHTLSIPGIPATWYMDDSEPSLILEHLKQSSLLSSGWDHLAVSVTSNFACPNSISSFLPLFSLNPFFLSLLSYTVVLLDAQCVTQETVGSSSAVCRPHSVSRTVSRL